MEQEFNNIINENKINKINDSIYLTNKQIEVLQNHQIAYQNCHDLKELLFLIDDIDDEEIEEIAMDISELNYYQYTNK